MMSYDYPHPVSRTYQYKKITKPLLERKRRARINRCLEELKDLMVDALETDNENISKLEKADILELTVRHLQKLHASRPFGLSSVNTSNDDGSDENRWRCGFHHCATEACKYLAGLPGESGEKLARHLASGLQSSGKCNIKIMPNGNIISITDNNDADSNHIDTVNNMNLMPIEGIQNNLSTPNWPQYHEVYNDENVNPVAINSQIDMNRTHLDIIQPLSPPINDNIIIQPQNSPDINTIKNRTNHDDDYKNNDDDEEIDVVRIDESDPMWRPW